MNDKELLDKLITEIVGYKEYSDIYYCSNHDYEQDINYLYALTMTRGLTNE